MNLAGVDIGFSLRRRSNAVAIFRDGELQSAERLSVVERNAALEQLIGIDVIAIDAPVLRAGIADSFIRQCESIFSRAPFQRRCKPGMSHVRGTGRFLRQHGADAALRAVVSGAKVVEAFPNAFLGVVLPGETFAGPPKIRRGGKFDWLYERWIERRLFELVVAEAKLPVSFAERCVRERDHELRAALVCVMTAAFVATANFAAIGDDAGGHFHLPPQHLWADWARDGVAAP